MTIEKLFTEYWSQFTLLLIGFGYFIKRIFDNISKRQEINHSLFQHKKLEVANSFFSTYAKAELIFTHIKIYQILRNEFTPSEIDEMVFPTINELKKNLIELQIYLDEINHKKFEQLFKNMNLINNKLSELFFSNDTNLTNTQKSNNYHFFREKIMEENHILLKEITTNLRKAFK